MRQLLDGGGVKELGGRRGIFLEEPTRPKLPLGRLVVLGGRILGFELLGRFLHGLEILVRVVLLVTGYTQLGCSVEPSQAQVPAFGRETSYRGGGNLYSRVARDYTELCPIVGR